MNLQSKRESHILETSGLCRRNCFTCFKEELTNLRLKKPNMLIKHLNKKCARNYVTLLKSKLIYQGFLKQNLFRSFLMENLKFVVIQNFIDLTEMEMLVLVFICEDIPTKLIEYQMKIKGFFIALIL